MEPYAILPATEEEVEAVHAGLRAYNRNYCPDAEDLSRAVGRLFPRDTGSGYGELLTNGGRVLNVVAKGDSFEEARERAYEACDLINWDGKFMRRDIGARAMKGRSAWGS